MNDNLLRSYIFVFFMSFALLTGVTRSFAQDDSSADEQAREQQAQESLNQIHDLEGKILNTQKRLDDLLNRANQTDPELASSGNAETNNSNQEASVAQETVSVPVPVQEAPVVQQAPSNASSVEEDTLANEQPVPIPVHDIAANEAAAVPAQRAAVTQQSAPVAVVQSISTDQPVSNPCSSCLERARTPIVAPAPVKVAPVDLSSFPRVHTFEISPEYFYSSYKEAGNYNKNGQFTGLALAYTYQPMDTDNWLINVFHADVHGDHAFESYSYAEDGDINHANDYIVEPRVWFGKNLIFDPNAILTPYVGFGYRWYYDGLTNKFTPSGNNGGNNIETQYFYIPIGAEFTVRPTYGWRLTFNSEFDPLVDGRIKNESANFNVNSTNINSPSYTNTLRHGYGVRGSIKLIKEGQYADLFIEPYINYWNIGTSNTVSATGYVNGTPQPFINQEGKNHTTEAGARLGVEF